MSFYSRTFLIAISFSLNVYCNNTNRTDEFKTNNEDSAVAKDLNFTNTRLQMKRDTSAPKFLGLKESKNIEVLSINKEVMKRDASDQSYIKCESWSLTADQLKFVIRKFDPISSEAQNLSYLYMPCRMTGTILIDGMDFKYWINAGSTLTLTNKDTTFYFGCSSKECQKFFITGKE